MYGELVEQAIGIQGKGPGRGACINHESWQDCVWTEELGRQVGIYLQHPALGGAQTICYLHSLQHLSPGH